MQQSTRDRQAPSPISGLTSDASPGHSRARTSRSVQGKLRHSYSRCPVQHHLLPLLHQDQECSHRRGNGTLLQTAHLWLWRFGRHVGSICWHALRRCEVPDTGQGQHLQEWRHRLRQETLSGGWTGSLLPRSCASDGRAGPSLRHRSPII